MTRSAQLDSIRGIAVLLVLIHHWTVWGEGLLGGLGNVGVQLFFVLSGFLITRILLGMSKRQVAGEASTRGLLSFHVSRITRIWPVAFLTLILVFAAGNRFAPRGDIAWHALFASNILFFVRGEFQSSLSHFWSLAVEQQFYLIWPLVVLMAPRAYLERIIFGLVAFAPAFRLVLHGLGMTDFAQFNVLPFANLDSLGMGAVLAIWSGLQTERAAGRWRILRNAAAIAVATLVALQFAAAKFAVVLPANLEQTLYSIAFAWLVGTAQVGFSGYVGRVLSWSPLAGIGAISYGIYVYHMFAPRIVGALMRAIGVSEAFQAGAPLLVGSALLTLAVALLSWFLLERPLLKLRKGRRVTSLDTTNTTEVVKAPDELAEV